MFNYRSFCFVFPVIEKLNLKEVKMKWYIIAILLIVGVIIGILTCLIFRFCCRRCSNRRKKRPQSDTEAKKTHNALDTSYEELDLTRVRNVYLTRNYEELDGNYENLDESKRDEKDDYQSLNTSDDDSPYDDVVPNVIPTHHYQNT